MFAHDTVIGLTTAADLVNTLVGSEERLVDPDGLARFLADHSFSGLVEGTSDELDAVRDLRAPLRRVWETDGVVAQAEWVNRQLRKSGAQPWLTNHDGLSWHLHVTDTEAPVARRVAAETAMALADLIRLNEAVRLRLCAAPDCRAVLVDLSRNRSRRFCDTGNCGNREHVAAYRQRKKAGA